METLGAAEDVFYEEEEEEEVNCYDFEPLPTLLEDEVSGAGAGMEPPPWRSPVGQRPQGRPRERPGRERTRPGSGQAAPLAPRVGSSLPPAPRVCSAGSSLPPAPRARPPAWA